MSYIKYNENPCDKRTIDCTVRALSVLLDQYWERIYVKLCLLGYDMCDMPSSKAVIHAYLKSLGYKKYVCPDGCTVKDFADNNPKGRYLLASNTHVIPVIYGNYIDTWDSGNEIVIQYWKKGGR